VKSVTDDTDYRSSVSASNANDRANDRTMGCLDSLHWARLNNLFYCHSILTAIAG
jgi:hypothetical protein